MRKGQASVELLVILAVSMVLIGIILVVSNEEIRTVNQIKANSDAQYTVDKIAKTSEEVFSAGTGTKKQIFISIPSGVDAGKSSIGNNTVRLNVNGTDIISEAKVELTGSIPTEAGGHWIWITAYAGYVLVGDIQIETDKGSIYSTIAQEATTIENIKVINNTGGNATVTVSVSWASSEVSLSLSENSFVVGAGSSYGIDLNFTSGSTAVGNYVGELVFDVDTVDTSKRIVVPLTVEVIISGGGEPLMIFPDFWNPTIDAGASDSNNFQVCSTTDSELTNIVFTSSSGDAGDWVQAIATIDSLAGNTCQEITVTINVPGIALSDTGIVTASDGTNSDYISLDVSIATMADNFYFDWSTATFNVTGTRLMDWTIGNTSSSATIVIARVIVWDWNELDQDNARLFGVRFNGNPEEWSGDAGAGDLLDNTDFTIPASTNYANGNRLRFNAVVNDDAEYFRITFEFLDGSTYTTLVYTTTPSVDSTPPIVVLEAPADNYASSEYTVDFNYNVNDSESGIAYCELIIDGSIDQININITEGVTQTFSKTFSSNGLYNWDVNCVDDSVNSNKGTSGENRRIRILVVGPPASIALHTFPDTSWGSGTGWLYPWTNSSARASITSTGIPYSLPYHLRLRRNAYAERAVDLSSYSNVTLKFWARINDFEGPDLGYVRVSPDRTSWTTIKTFTSADSDDIYRLYEFNLTDYTTLSNEFWIRFEIRGNNNNDYFYIDDVNVVEGGIMS